MQASPAQTFGTMLNGNTFDGWQVIGGASQFSIQGGVVTGVALSGSNTFLRSPDIYQDFVLTFDTRIEGGPGFPNNSGMQIRSTFANGAVRGYQVDMDAVDMNKLATLYEEGNRRLTLHDGPEHEALRQSYIPFDSGWNSVEIIADGDTITTRFNSHEGSTYVETRPPASESNYYPIQEGFIAMQIHGVGHITAEGAIVQWRNIEIHPVPTTLLGDLDGDHDVDDADFATSFANYTGPVGASGGKTLAQGDTDFDGDVDDSDLGASFAAYTGPNASPVVPEPPATAALILAICLFHLRHHPRASSSRISAKKPDALFRSHQETGDNNVSI